VKAVYRRTAAPAGGRPARRRGAAALLAVAVAALGGCGEAPSKRSAEPAPETAGRPSPAADSGRAVFLSQCQGCHSLTGLGARRPAGGDLAGYSMTPAEVASYARVMPTPRPLTERELALVARFVSDGQRKAKRSGGRGRG
jgi:mono/diheme cytochrome c family protein